MCLRICELWEQVEGKIAIVYTLLLMILLFMPVNQMDAVSPGLNLDKGFHILGMFVTKFKRELLKLD
jgi:hypothetical protein